MGAYEKVTDLAYGENPHQRAAYYQQVGARMHVLSMVRQLGGQASCRSTTCSTSTPRACSCTSSRCRPARSSSTTTRAGARPRGSALEAYERAFACDPLSAFGGVVTRQPRRSTRRSPRRSSSSSARSSSRPRFTDGGARDPRRQAEHADPRGQRAPPRQRRRARPQARDGRPARAGPRHGPRGPLGDGGRHRAQADRARVGRDAVRLEGLQARALQRDRARPRTSPPSASAPGR